MAGLPGDALSPPHSHFTSPLTAPFVRAQATRQLRCKGFLFVMLAVQLCYTLSAVMPLHHVLPSVLLLSWVDGVLPQLLL